MSNIKPLGFWRQTVNSKENLPFPTEMIDTSWSKSEKKQVINYIKSFKPGNHQKGTASCRICNERLGSGECSDGNYVFPEKFEHYLEKHNVKPPQEFVNIALNKANRR